MINSHLCMGTLLAVVVSLGAQSAIADGRFVDIAPKNIEEIQLVLDTLEMAILDDQTDIPPIVMMLHGDEAHRFLRKNYVDNKSLVDQTAKLAAYAVINVQICATWLSTNDYSSADIFPFVSTVPYGAAELDRLVNEEGYREFSVNL